MLEDKGEGRGRIPCLLASPHRAGCYRMPEVSHHLERLGLLALVLGLEKLLPRRLNWDRRPGDLTLGRLTPLV